MEQSLSQRQHYIGSILLIAGCCIGGGMVSLPLATALAGFLPSALLLLVSWFFMLVTGLLLVEVYLYFSDHISLGTMAFRTMGRWGERFVWLLFLFIFYSLLIAYVSGSGSVISDLSVTYFGLAPPPWVSSLLLTLFVGVFIYLGTESTDMVNRIMMMGLFISYALLLIFALPHVSTENLSYVDWNESWFILPTFIVSFGYHNLIPGIGHYVKRNVRLFRMATIIGSSIPFIIYLFWEWIILGIVPLEGEAGFRACLESGCLVPQILRGVLGYSFISEITQAFTFFAILTSFLTIALSITDFLSDGLKLPKEKPINNFMLCLAVLIPPFIFALTDPTLFLTALRHAGGLGAVVLYGVFPVIMVWRGRYYLNLAKTHIVPGGKGVLALTFFISVAIVGLHIYKEFA